MKSWMSKNRQLLLRLAGSLLAFGLMAVLAYQNWAEVVSAASQIALWRFLLALALVFVSRFFVTLRWHVLLRTAGVEIPLARSVLITFTGLFASNFLPTTIGGDVARFGGAVELGYSSSITLASLVVDRLVGMAGMAMAVPFGLLPLLKWGTANAAPAFAVAGLWQKGLGFATKTLSALKLWTSKPGGLIGALACTWGHMLCTFASVSILLDGLNSPVSFWRIAGLWSMAYFITLIPVSINGYGLQEISLTYLFAHVGGAGMASSLALAVLIRVLTIIASLPGAFFLPSIMAALDKSSQK